MVRRLLTTEKAIINWNKSMNRYSVFGRYSAKLQYLDRCKTSMQEMFVLRAVVTVSIAASSLLDLSIHVSRRSFIWRLVVCMKIKGKVRSITLRAFSILYSDILLCKYVDSDKH